jgi:hypothetical protein
MMLGIDRETRVMRTMDTSGKLERFSLLGGPFYRLGCKLGLVRSGTNTVALGFAFGVFLWIVLVVLAFIEGVQQQLFSLSLIGVHVRLLVAIPLFFLCESWLDPRMTVFVSMIGRSGVVPDTELPALDSEVQRNAQWSDSWVAEAICLLAAVLLSLAAKELHMFGRTTVFDPNRAADVLAIAALWYWVVCLTLFRFLIFRWIWRIGLWSYFLWRVAKLQLNLIPTHPDGVAGLGYLEVVHDHFTPLVLAISVIQAASLAEEIYAGKMTFGAIYPALAFVLILDAALFLGPLFIFSTKLWACRVKGLSDYMIFAGSYVSGFDRKWLGADNSARGEPLLGTPDLQSLADLSNSVNIVRNMRIVPLSLHLLTDLAIAAAFPMLPLLLFKYPLAELIAKFFARLTGL